MNRGTPSGFVWVALLCAFLAAPKAASAQTSTNEAPREQEGPFDGMHLLAQHGLHDVADESWNAYAQFTYISSWKPAFSAAYTNLNGSTNSLLPDPERSFTGSLTFFLGKRLWKGGELYFVPEVISERPFSNLRGLGGAIQNFELQKTGAETPQLYRSRVFLRQSFALGGEDVVKASGAAQLGTTVKSRRIVITAGNFSVLDVLDKNGVTGDPRQTFFNMAFMTHASWDFAADARGYSFGAVAELFWDNFAVRIARMAPPLHPNTLPIDLRLWKFYGDSLELEHDHVLFGRPGVIRLVAYRNYESIGRYDEAISAFEQDPSRNAASCTSFNYGSSNATAPDLCWVRRPNQKVGIGLAGEQFVADDVGIFFRAMYSDGESEVDAFNAADQSVSVGASAKGTLWNRPKDVTGVGLGLSFISAAHAKYLGMGGIDGFVGDGALHPGAEGVVEAFYSVNLFRAFWLAGDYQFIWNPGFNQDRGPLHVIGAKIHAEF